MEAVDHPVLEAQLPPHSAYQIFVPPKEVEREMRVAGGVKSERDIGGGNIGSGGHHDDRLLPVRDRRAA
jgi:hypothetical protein